MRGPSSLIGRKSRSFQAMISLMRPLALRPGTSSASKPVSSMRGGVHDGDTAQRQAAREREAAAVVERRPGFIGT